MRHSVHTVNPPRLVFENPYNAPRWLNDMSLRLARFVPDPLERRRLLINIQYETTRAGLERWPWVAHFWVHGSRTVCGRITDDGVPG